VCRNHGFELADERGVTAERELRVDPLLERGHAQLVEPCRRQPRELLVVEIRERRAAPEGQRLAQERRSLRPVTVARIGKQSFEAMCVDTELVTPAVAGTSPSPSIMMRAARS